MFQSVYARLESDDAFFDFKDALTTDPRLDVKVERESEYYAARSRTITGIVRALGFLVAGLMGSGAATAAMAGFEDLIQAHVAVAFFVPALVYLADAIGTQSEAIAVRGLSLTRTGIAHLVAGELRTGALIGAVLGTLAFAIVGGVYRDVQLAGAVGTALFAAGTIASGIGISFPWALSRLLVRRDGRELRHGASFDKLRTSRARG